jgi:hypothetical protein
MFHGMKPFDCQRVPTFEVLNGEPAAADQVVQSPLDLRQISVYQAQHLLWRHEVLRKRVQDGRFGPGDVKRVHCFIPDK